MQLAVLPDALRAPLPVLSQLGGHLEPLWAGGAAVGRVAGVGGQVVVVAALQFIDSSRGKSCLLASANQLSSICCLVQMEGKRLD